MYSADRAVHVGGCPSRPDAGRAILLPDSGFVLPPQLDRLTAGLLGDGRMNETGKALWDGPPLLPGSVSCPGNRKEGGRQMEIMVLGINLGKNSCSVVESLDSGGHVVLRRRLHRDGVAKLAAGLPSCIMTKVPVVPLLLLCNCELARRCTCVWPVLQFFSGHAHCSDAPSRAAYGGLCPPRLRPACPPASRPARALAVPAPYHHCAPQPGEIRG